MKRLFSIMGFLALFGVAAATYFSLRPDVAPQSSFVMLDGSQKATQSWNGNVTLVNFWATSCTTCVAEMPQLVDTYTKFAPKGFETVAVAMNYDPPEYVRNYAARNALPFKVALDSDGTAAKGFEEVRLTPTTFLLDKQGRIVQKYLGAPDFPKLHALLEKLLAEPA